VYYDSQIFENDMGDEDHLTKDSSDREILAWWRRMTLANGSLDARSKRGENNEGLCPKCASHTSGLPSAEFGLNKCPVNGVMRIMSKGAAEDLSLKKEPLLIPDVCLNGFVSAGSFDEEHVRHVSPYAEKPGLVASVLVPSPEDEKIRVVQVFLIDGTHRAVNCLRAGVPFKAYVLDFHETLSSMVYFGMVFNSQYGFMNEKPVVIPERDEVARWVGCKVEDLVRLAAAKAASGTGEEKEVDREVKP
jgi:hypothetical protein